MRRWLRSRTRRAIFAAAVLVVVGSVCVGLVTGLLGSAARDVLHGTGLLTDGGASTLPTPDPDPSPTPDGPVTPAPAPAATPAPVLAPVRAVPATSRAALQRRLESVPTGGMGGSWTGAVTDVGRNRVLYGHERTVGYIPASTMKLLTATAALQLLGPDHRFRTEVVQGSGRRIVLVGGGDPYLTARPVTGVYPARASMTGLAAATATALERAHRTTVTLGYDASLFSGPVWNPRWPGSYADQVSPMSALRVDEGRVNGGSPGPRVADPTAVAVDAFAAALRARGIEVTGSAAVTASPGARRIASVESMPLADIVGETLLHSDNDAAEVLLRQAGLAAGHSGSFAGGVAGVRKALTRLGVLDPGTVLYDGSGLGRDNRVSADQLVELITAAASGEHTRLRPLLTGMPTAAVDGSLRYRFGDAAGRPARGVLRAKTGTLTEVHSLAGWTVTRDGSVLAFAFVANGMTNEYASTRWLEHVTAAVAACGCS